MENSLNSEKKKKQAICGSIKIVNIPSYVLQVTVQTWSQNFPKHLSQKKRPLQPRTAWVAGKEEGWWDKLRSSSDSPRRGQVTSSSSGTGVP